MWTTQQQPATTSMVSFMDSTASILVYSRKNVVAVFVFRGRWQAAGIRHVRHGNRLKGCTLHLLAGTFLGSISMEKMVFFQAVFCFGFCGAVVPAPQQLELECTVTSTS